MRTYPLVRSCAPLVAILGLVTVAAGASLPTHALVTIVEATEISHRTTESGADGDGWTVDAPADEPVQISLEWRTLEGRPAAAAATVGAQGKRSLVLTLVVCRE